MWQIQFLVLAFFLFETYGTLFPPEVELPTGRIRGRNGITEKKYPYYAFEKIPYAEPPERFKPPVPKSKWRGTLETTRIDVTCYQEHQYTPKGVKESEDCLFINVVTPELPQGNEHPSLPVLFYIYGGKFLYDSSVNFVTSDGITENGVILVTFNYRTNLFGFLSTEDEVIPGNYGLKDQRLALEWTHQNIHVFGGDPEKITIFGESAGAMSCGYHMLHLPNNGLFRGAILQSGSPLTSTGYQREARERAFNLAALINPLYTFYRDSKDLLKFLQSVDADLLISASRKLFRLAIILGINFDEYDGKNWAPVLEKNSSSAIITQSPYQQLKEGKVIKVPILIGINSEEMISYVKVSWGLRLLFLYFDFHVNRFAPLDMNILNMTARKEVGSLVRDIYVGDKCTKLFSFHLCDIIRFLSDFINKSVIKFAEMYSQYEDTYFYEFAYDGKLGGIDQSCSTAESVGHFEEDEYLFCSYPKCNISSYPISDQLTQKQLTTIWTDFAKTLNPTPKKSSILSNITWPLVSTEEGDFFYVLINESLVVKNHPKNDTYPKWVELYDSLPDDFDTY